MQDNGIWWRFFVSGTQSLITTEARDCYEAWEAMKCEIKELIGAELTSNDPKQYDLINDDHNLPASLHWCSLIVDEEESQLVGCECLTVGEYFEIKPCNPALWQPDDDTKPTRKTHQSPNPNTP